MGLDRFRRQSLPIQCDPVFSLYVQYDKSVMESFFGTMKREELYRTKYRSEREFKAAVDDYVIFYNDNRPHKKLMYKTPLQYEAEHFSKQADFKNF